MRRQAGPRLWVVASTLAAASLLAAGAIAATTADSGPAGNGAIRWTLIYYGNAPPLREATLPLIARFDLVAIDRWRYQDLRPDSWTALRRANPAVTILTYQLGPQAATTWDQQQTVYLNNIARYRMSRGRPGGTLAQDHAEWLLSTPIGTPFVLADAPDFVWLDFGDPGLIDFWLGATKADLVDRPWTADGVLVDNCSVDVGGTERTLVGRRPARYMSGATWNAAMNRFVSKVSAGLQASGQRVLANRGGSRTPDGYAAWLDLDQADGSTPDYAMEEGAFAVRYGPGDVQFYPADQWLRQVALAQNVRRSATVYVSHTDIGPGMSGIDADGRQATFGQVLSFAVASYLLARIDEPARRTLFAFDASRNGPGYARAEYFAAFEALTLGEPRGPFRPAPGPSATTYLREFTGGIVVVNPGTIGVAHELERPGRLFSTEDGQIARFKAVTDRVELAPHSAAIVLY